MDRGQTTLTQKTGTKGTLLIALQCMHVHVHDHVGIPVMDLYVEWFLGFHSTCTSLCAESTCSIDDRLNGAPSLARETVIKNFKAGRASSFSL